MAFLQSKLFKRSFNEQAMIIIIIGLMIQPTK